MALGSEQKVVTNAAAQQVAYARDAEAFLIRNTDPTVSVYVGEAGVTVANGYELKPGAAFIWHGEGKQKLYAKSAGANVVLGILKGGIEEVALAPAAAAAVTFPTTQADVAAIPKGAQAVAAADTAIVAANPARLEVTLCNDHATAVIYLALGAAAVLNQGIRLGPGQSYSTATYRGAIRGISTVAGAVCTFSEV